jgi:hypothetical protein
MAAIEIEGLTKRFGDVVAVDNLSLRDHEIGTECMSCVPNIRKDLGKDRFRAIQPF